MRERGQPLRLFQGRQFQSHRESISRDYRLPNLELPRADAGTRDCGLGIQAWS
jgi:hypothetical protein